MLLPCLLSACLPGAGPRDARLPATILDVQSLPFHPHDPRGLGTRSSPRVGAVPQGLRARLLSAPGGTRLAFGALCAPAGIIENMVIPMIWRVSQPSHVHMSGQCGDSRLTWRGAHATGEGPLPAPGRKCFSSLRGKWQGEGSLSALPHHSSLYLSFSVGI